jgi:5-methylthioadenosine/S-adenosylhomocysteine deaminase
MESSLKPEQVTLLAIHATLLTMDAGHTVIQDGAIAVLNNKIVALGNTDDLLHRFQAAEVIDAGGCIIIPGLINAHTHIPMSYFKGLADDLPLKQWLNDYIWPLEKHFILDKPSPTPEFVYDATLHGAAELIKNGLTLANDMYFEGDAMAQAVSKAGLRCIIGDPILGNSGVQKEAISKIGQAALELTQKYKDNPLVDFSLAPHAIYSVSQSALERCAEVALEHDLPVHMHISEAQPEIPDCLQKHGKKPVHYLQEIGLLKTKLVLAHGIWVAEDEMELLAEHNASVALCTESNLKLANGFAPVKNYMRHGVNICFGTDGVASNNNQDLLSELDFTAKLHKALNHDPTFLPAEQMLMLATMGAAKALYRDKELGSLEIGKQADLVILDCNSVEAQPVFNPYSQVIYALGGRSVRDVIINGTFVLRNKQLTRLDEAELVARAKAYQTRINKELKL